MVNKFLILTLLLSTWSCAEKSVQLSAEPPVVPVLIEPVKPAEPLRLKKFDYSFEEIHSAANYATVVFSRRINDQIAHKKSPKIFKCDPSDDEINVWTMQLKSLIDEQTLYVEQNILTDKKYADKFAQCETTCMCGEYAAILQNFNPSQLNKTQLFQLTDMDRKHKAMTDEQTLACAKQFKGFCGSKLHKYLKKIVQQ
ncbi:MAG: hypothetical protein H7235_04045 [Bdellovibrionaceae bacterium]|nr:hypothetical protein [Pseudobdellovibrionaceae bacterium]